MHLILLLRKYNETGARSRHGLKFRIALLLNYLSEVSATDYDRTYFCTNHHYTTRIIRYIDGSRSVFLKPINLIYRFKPILSVLYLFC